MGKLRQFWRGFNHFRWGVVGLPAAACFVALLWWLRRLPYAPDPLFYGYLEMVGTLIAFTYAANALVRFKGTHDRISLILAFGFVLSGLIETASSLASFGVLREGAGAQLTIPLAWMVSRTLLAILLVAALEVEKRLPHALDPGREIAAAFFVVVAVAYMTSAAYFGVLGEPTIRPGTLIPRPWDLLPAAIFLAAAVGYERRLKNAQWSFDRAICLAAALNVVCHVVASQSERLLDAPFTFAVIVKVSSYALVLGGALLDNAQLFDRVRHLAVTDPLTGLANYRRLIDVLDAEIKRSQRTGRTFSVLLLDLDGLKKINDRHGHLVGSRALCRLADVLRVDCRATDTPARYGGDEFAVILPETGPEAAQRVAGRIRERLANDGEQPAVSVSVGSAVYPRDGETIEALLGAADRALYGMKAGIHGNGSLSRIAACL